MVERVEVAEVVATVSVVEIVAVAEVVEVAAVEVVKVVKVVAVVEVVNIPNVFPRTSQHLALTLFQVPRCISSDRSPSCRARVMISAMTNSATLRELAKGELKTAIPRRAA